PQPRQARPRTGNRLLRAQSRTRLQLRRFCCLDKSQDAGARENLPESAKCETGLREKVAKPGPRDPVHGPCARESWISGEPDWAQPRATSAFRPTPTKARTPRRSRQRQPQRRLGIRRLRLSAAWYWFYSLRPRFG